MVGFSTYFHGVELREDPKIPAEVSELRTNVIGIVGISKKIPANEPILITSEEDLEKVFAKEEGEEEDSLKEAIKVIYTQGQSLVIAIAVSDAAAISGDLGQLFGVYALLKAEEKTGFKPKILLTSENSEDAGVREALRNVAEKLYAVALIDMAESKTAKEVILEAKNLTSSRLYALYPKVKVVGFSEDKTYPMSLLVAGAIAYNDSQNGFFTSPSNKIVKAVLGLSKPVPYSLQDPNSDANLLNEAGVTTIIRQSGFRLWGSRTLGKTDKVDEANRFLNVRRTSDVLSESLIDLCFKKIDQNVTRNFVDIVLEDMNAYLRDLKRRGAILGGQAFFDPKDNPESQIIKGTLLFRVEYSAVYPAEQIKLVLSLTDKYIAEALG